MPMNNSQNRVVDPVLTQVAHGYTNPERIGSLLFPRVESPKRGAQVIRFGKEAFYAYVLRRAPGARKQRVMYGFAAEPIALVQDALEGQVPLEWVEESEGVPNINHETRAVNNVMSSLTLGLEREQAALATDATKYAAENKTTLSGTDQWSHPDADPGVQIRDYKNVVRRKTGVYPNVMEIGAKAWEAIQSNQKIREQFKYTSAESITVEMAARYFQVAKLEIGTGVTADPANPDADFEDIWGDQIVLAYVPQQGQNIEVPSFGYTYELPGHPQVMKSYWEDATDSWIYPMRYDRQAILTGVDAGFLIQNVRGG